MDPDFRPRWNAIALPDWQDNDLLFQQHIAHRKDRRVLNCAITKARAQQLTDFVMPDNWSPHLCLVTSGAGRFEPGLEQWRYQPHIRPEPQLPQLQKLPPQFADLSRLPWFASQSQCLGLKLNSRLLRYHHDFWRDLKPKTLRGVHTTLVFVTPQLSYALAPHIELEKMFRYFAAFSRACGPAQLFPAKYLYPDAELGSLRDAPCAIFADLVPTTGGFALPTLECTPDPWGILSHYDQSDVFYGYPFSRISDPHQDTVLHDDLSGSMLLPDGSVTRARRSQSQVYATLDETLQRDLLLDRTGFVHQRCLGRGCITHDGLPFQLPVELQCFVFAVVLTHWEMTLDHAGDLNNYTLNTKHAAIRSFNYYQRVEPYYSQFMHLVTELGQDPDFKTYPLSTHLTNNWLGGNLLVSNQASFAEHETGADLMRNYYLQQLDWLAGVANLWNHHSFRRGKDLESSLSFDGLVFHQMRRMLHFESQCFNRPTQRPSPWPKLHRGWLELDRQGMTRRLPRLV